MVKISVHFLGVKFFNSQIFLMLAEDADIFNPFMHYVEKWPNVLEKSYSMNTNHYYSSQIETIKLTCSEN